MALIEHDKKTKEHGQFSMNASTLYIKACIDIINTNNTYSIMSNGSHSNRDRNSSS